MINNYDELLENRKENDMKGVYKKFEMSLKLVKKIVPEIENNKLSKSMSQFIPQKKSLLNALKPLMVKNDSESFFKTIEPVLAKMVAELKEINNNKN